MLSALKNPYVIGGVGLAIVLVALAKGGSKPSASVDPFTAANAAGGALMAANAQTAVAISADQMKTNIARDAAMFSAFSNMVAVNDQLAARSIESQNGVFATQIQSQAAVAIDRANNAARLDATFVQAQGATETAYAKTAAQIAASQMQLGASVVGAGVQMHQVDVSSRTAVTIAQTQAAAAQSIAQTQANAAMTAAALNNNTAQQVSSNNMWGNIASSAMRGAGTLFAGLMA